MSLPWANFLNQRDVRETSVQTQTSSNFITIGGNKFKSNTNAQDFSRSISSFTLTASGSVYADFTLPDGAVITGVIVYGSDSTNTYSFNQCYLSNGANNVIGSGNVNTEDVSISAFGTVDNSISSYGFLITMGAGDTLYGARVTYTI